MARAVSIAASVPSRAAAGAAWESLVRRLRLVAIPLVMVGIVCAFYAEVVFGGRTFLPLGLGYGGVMGSAGPFGYPDSTKPDLYRWDRGASSWQIEPAARVIGEQLRSGELPLWNPHQGFGAPLLANAQSGALDLLRLPVILSGAPWVWDAYYLGRTLLTLGLVYLLVRRVGWSKAAALAAGCAYAFSGFMLILGNNHYIEVYALLPALLLGTDLMLTHRRLGLLVLTASVAMSVLAGMPECTAVTFVFGASYGVYLTCRQLWLARRIGAVVPFASTLLVGWLVGLALSAPMVLPMAEYLAEGVHQHESTNFGLAYQPIQAIAYLAVPYLWGLPGERLAGNQFLVVKDYVGGAVCLLACVGAVATLTGRLGRLAPFALGSALFWGAKLFGAPIVNEIGRLPGLNVSFILDWGRPLLSLSLALLAAAAIEAAGRLRLGWRPLFGSMVVFVAYFAGALALNTDRVASMPASEIVTTVGIAATTAAAAAALLAIGREWVVGCVVMILGELFVLSPHDVYPARYDPLTPAPFMDVLRADAPFRIFGVNGYVYPNLASGFGLDDIRAVDAVYPSRYMAYVRGLLAPAAQDRYTGNEPQTNLADNRWLDLAGVRDLLLQPGAPLPAGYDLVYDGEVRVARNAHAFPRAFLTPGIRAVRNTDRALQVMQQEQAFDPSRTGLIEGALPPGVSGEARNLEDPGEVSIRRYTGTDVDLQVRTPAQRLLVLTDAYYPGWQATVDGQPATIFPTDLAFRGIVVDPGLHEVQFRYAPASLTLGGLLAAGGLVALGCALWLSRRSALENG